METTVPYFLNEYYGTITWAYVLIIPLFLAGFLFDGMKKESPNILSAINLTLGMMGFYMMALFLEFFIELFLGWSGDQSTEYFRFSYTDSTASTFRNWAMWMIQNFLETTILLFFLFSKRARASWFLSFFMLVLINWFFLVQWMARLHGEFLPSILPAVSFSVRLMHMFIFWLLVVFSYIFLARYNKLPYPSILYKVKRKKDVL